jgi:hypothetical protein
VTRPQEGLSVEPGRLVSNTPAVTYARAGAAHTGDGRNYTRTERTLGDPRTDAAGEAPRGRQREHLAERHGAPARRGARPARRRRRHRPAAGARASRQEARRRLHSGALRRGEETPLDASVRDTGEITPDRVTLAGDSWQASLSEKHQTHDTMGPVAIGSTMAGGAERVSASGPPSRPPSAFWPRTCCRRWLDQSGLLNRVGPDP